MAVLPYAKPGRNWAFPDYTVKYPRDPKYLLKHYVLKVRLNIPERSVEGSATLTIIPATEPLEFIEVDACEMDVKSVRGADGALKYEYDGSVVRIYLPKAIQGKEEVIITVDYWTKPRKGLYFILPDKNHPKRIPQVWSQGEAEDNRYWMPIYDYPNLKCTWEVIATVPLGYKCVSNGSLVGIVEDEEQRTATWHWKMDKPHSPYLISLVAGEFSELREEVEGIPLLYYIPKGREEDAQRSFGKTGDMLRFFGEYTGMKYPYSKYAQTCVSEFIFGGMENVTATTLTDATLHDEKAHADFSSDPLVAHELAHMWFGDLVTTKDWANIWLNEAFATYMENLYLRKDKGVDEFIYTLYSDLKLYLEEYEKRYSRPIVTRLYKYPQEMFDRHTYEKGGLILHTLNCLVGEGKFREALRLFLTNFKYRNADTEDLRKVFEEVTGRNLEWFFDQFVYNAGHPVVKAQESWDAATQVFSITFKQTQADDSPEIYRLGLELRIVGEDGEELRKEVIMDRKELTLYIPLKTKPKYVCIDPDFKVFKLIEIERGLEDWVTHLKACKHVYCRLLAVEALGKLGGYKAIEALKDTLMGDAFWGVSAEAAKALGKLKTPDAMKALIESLAMIKHPKVRRAVAEALGNFKDKEAASALVKILSDDGESYYVRSQSAISLGKTGWAPAFEWLTKALSVPSHNHVITTGALQGLSELGGEEALKIIYAHTSLDMPTIVRVNAVNALGKFPGRKDVIDKLDELSSDEYLRVRQAVITAAEELLDHRLLTILDRMALTDLHDSVRRRAREVARKIREHMEKGTEYKLLREEVERVREENRRLLDRIARLEGKGT